MTESMTPEGEPRESTPEDGAPEPPAPGEAESESEAPSAGEAGEGERVSASPADPTATAEPAQRQEGEEGLKTTPGLLLFCVLLFAIAGGILAYRYRRMKVDYYLGTIRTHYLDTGSLDNDAVEALAAMGETALPYLEENLDPKRCANPFVRVSCVLALAKMDSPAARALLEKAIDDEDPRVRYYALVHLLRADPGPHRDQAILYAKESPVSAMRALMLTALAETVSTGDLEVERALVAGLLDGYPAVRAAAHAGLVKIVGKDRDLGFEVNGTIGAVRWAWVLWRRRVEVRGRARSLDAAGASALLEALGKRERLTAPLFDRYRKQVTAIRAIDGDVSALPATGGLVAAIATGRGRLLLLRRAALPFDAWDRVVMRLVHWTGDEFYHDIAWPELVLETTRG